MPQIFHRSSNTLARVSILGGLFIVGMLSFAVYGYMTGDYTTQVHVARDQPVRFSHEHHVAGLGIDCRYCHTSVTESPFAGLPPTKVCMTCHSQIWTNAALLEPVRQSWRTDTPIPWTRVNSVPGYVYFNHSIHVAKGVGCATCHGPVDKMPLTYQAQSLQMRWCLECHRNPEQYLRPREEVFNMGYKPPPDQEKLGHELAERYHVRDSQTLTNCSTCHR